MTQRNLLNSACLLLATAAGLVGALYWCGEALDACSGGRPLLMDEAILKSFRAWGGRRWEGPMLQITALGSKTIITLVAVLAFCATWLARERLIALKVAMVALGSGLLTLVVKLLVERPRPGVTEWRDPYIGDTFSFPSGHSLSSMAVYASLGFLLAKLAPNKPAARFTIAAGFGVAVLVGLSRVYLGVHNPTDVAAGWAAGLAWALACTKALQWVRADNSEATLRS
jgi:undecaprenyl-diphosphatase